MNFSRAAALTHDPTSHLGASMFGLLAAGPAALAGCLPAFFMIAPLVKNSDTVTGVVAAQLRAAQAAGDTPARLDPDLEAFSLMAMSAGLATSVLAGQSSIQQAQAVIDYHLDRLFPRIPASVTPSARERTSHRPRGGLGPPARMGSVRNQRARAWVSQGALLPG
jgi:hypothetical protein